MVSITERYGVDTRRLGGRYGVDQNARILTRFRDAEFHSMLAMMAWMPRVAEWEVKKEMGVISMTTPSTPTSLETGSVN